MLTDNKGNAPKAAIDLLETPFEHIALAFSGGGFRAGAFGQGVLSFLNYIPLKENEPTTLLEKVTYMSSASGGTITTSMYALYNVQGKPFSAYYKDLSERMFGTGLVEKALFILNDHNSWHERPEKSRNLINAFAMAYDKLLFGSATVADLKKNPQTHLEEVCFNSTELYNGLLFRQAIKLKNPPGAPIVEEGFLYGNFNLSLDHQTADQLFLSDLLAASSCFPGGFEPILFPKDFIGPKTSRQQLLNGLNVRLQEMSWDELDLLYRRDQVEAIHNQMPKPLNVPDFTKKVHETLPVDGDLKISLMDGGITDNQGLESMILANDRRVKDKAGFPAFDLMMVCDVGSHYMKAYELPQAGKKSRWTINRIRITGIVTAIIAAIASGLLFYCATQAHTYTGIIARSVGGSITLLLMSIALLVAGAIHKAKRFISGQVNGGSGLDLDKTFSAEIVALLFKHFGNLRLNRLKYMLLERLTTLLTLTSYVFLNRIRYLLYDQFFNQNDLKATGRAKANHIYDLSFSNDNNRADNYVKLYQPSEIMQLVAESAFDMSTTLWFSKDDNQQQKQACIIACGQFNTCYNLLDYIAKLKTGFDGRPPVYNNFSPDNKKLVDDLQIRLQPLFQQFCDDPFWLYNTLGKQYGIQHFVPADKNLVRMPDDFKGLR